MTLEENLAKAEAYLKQFQSGPIHHRIGGKDVLASDGKTFDSFSPVDMSPLATVAQGTVEDIDAACQSAKAAFSARTRRPLP